MDTREIPLTQGEVTLVSAADYEFLSQWKWYAGRAGRTWYAQREQSKTCLKMHRVILGSAVGIEVDHINHDGLDNRRENIRIATSQENVHNQRCRVDSTTGFKGVALNKVRGKPFRAHINAPGRSRHIGLYNTAVDAARAYNLEAIKYFGEFAYLNKID
jgi:hypothetical protein